MTDVLLGVYVTGVLSFVVLVFASWCVGEGGEILGKKYDASIIGGLVIAWLNTAPETIFFITALNSNNPRFAVGAVSGSSIVVCTVALGTCLYIGSRASKSGSIFLQPAVRRQCQILGVSVIVASVTAFVGFNLFCGFAGIAFYVWFLMDSLRTKSTDNEEVKEDEPHSADEEKGGHAEEAEEEASLRKGVLFLVCGGVLISMFSSIFINAVVEIASLLEVNPILLAFFLAPIASEAPEILESISLSRKGNAQNINIACSNLMGGTITKTTLLCGIFSLFGVFRGFVWESPSYSLCLVLQVICAVAAAGIGVFAQRQTKWHGLLLFALFAVTGIIQFTTNTRLESEVFADEGFGHDDKHTHRGRAFAQSITAEV